MRPGENIPVDGVVLEGSSAVNEAALTGESIPVDKDAGRSGLRCDSSTSPGFSAARPPVWERTRRLSQIIKMVSDAAATKGTDCQDRRPGVRRICSGGHRRLQRSRLIVIWLLGADRPSPLRWREVFRCWSSAARVRSDWRRRWRSWSETVWVPKTGYLFKTAVSLEETGKVQILSRWIRPARSPGVSRR